MIAPYVILFTVTTLFVAVAGSVGSKITSVRWVSASIAILLVSVFAGIRDFEVGGPDVMIYGNRVFNAMAATPELSGMFNYAIANNVQGEAGYYFLNWVVSRYTTDEHVFYSVLAAFTSTIILMAIMLLRKHGSPSVMWLTYLLTAYVEGFNLLRQSPALALAVLGVALVLRSKYGLGLLVGATGLLFHNSAVVFFIMWGVAVYLKTRRQQVGRAVWVVLVVGVLALIAVAPALDLLSNSLADSKYQEYLGEGARGGRAFGVDALYRAVPLVVGIWALTATRPRALKPAPVYAASTRRRVLEIPVPVRVDLAGSPSKVEQITRRAVIAVLALLALELVLLPAREISYPFYRLLAYFGYLRVIGYGLIVGLIPKHRLAAGLAAVAFALAYFLLIVLGRNEAYYSSMILDEWLQAS